MVVLLAVVYPSVNISILFPAVMVVVAIPIIFHAGVDDVIASAVITPELAISIQTGCPRDILDFAV